MSLVCIPKEVRTGAWLTNISGVEKDCYVACRIPRK